MKFKGTKGEWNSCCTQKTPHFLFAHDGELTICSFIKNQETGIEYSETEMRANAKLIASAPDLLESLMLFIDPLTGLVCDHIAHVIGSEHAYKIEQAIEKALQ